MRVPQRKMESITAWREVLTPFRQFQRKQKRTRTLVSQCKHVDLNFKLHHLHLFSQMTHDVAKILCFNLEFGLCYSSSNISVSGPTSIPNGSSGHEHAPHQSAGITCNICRGIYWFWVLAHGNNAYLQTFSVKRTPPPLPLLWLVLELNKGRGHLHFHLLACSTNSVFGVYFSASDPVVVPPLNSRNPGVGAIKDEVSSQRIASKSGASNPAVNGSIAEHTIANSVQATLGDVTCVNTGLQESLIVEKNEPLEHSQSSSLTTTSEVISVIDGQSSLLVGLSEGIIMSSLHLAYFHSNFGKRCVLTHVSNPELVCVFNYCISSSSNNIAKNSIIKSQFLLLSHVLSCSASSNE